MKTSGKFLLFAGITGLILFAIGMIISVAQCGWNLNEGNFDNGVGFYNAMSAVGAILALITFFIFLIRVEIKMHKERQSEFVKYGYSFFAFPAYIGLAVTIILYLLLDFEWLHACIDDGYIVIVTYQHIFEALLSAFSTPLFWIAIAITEIVMTAKYIFFKKERVKAENEL